MTVEIKNNRTGGKVERQWKQRTEGRAGGTVE